MHKRAKPVRSSKMRLTPILIPKYFCSGDSGRLNGGLCSRWRTLSSQTLKLGLVRGVDMSIRTDRKARIVLLVFNSRNSVSET